MALNIQNFSQLVQMQAAAIQASASQVIDFAQGSVMRALVQANGALGLWLQSLIVRVLSLTRAATSSASDLDSWMADYGFARIGAAASTGVVTFSRYTATAQGFVPVGARVQTADKSQTFTVIADPTNSAYNASLSGFTLAAGVSSLGILVRANTAGAAGNIAAGTIAVIYGAISGIDYVSNASSFAGGVDAETDASFRSRFTAFLLTLSKGTKAAIAAAVSNIQVGAYATVIEWSDYSGNSRSAYFYVVVDDGSGAPSSAFLAAARVAIEAVRPAGINYGVFAPVIVSASVNMTIETGSSYTHSTVATAVVEALQSYIGGLLDGETLPYSKLAQIAYDASPGVVNVTGVTLNSGTSDLVPTSAQVIKPLLVTVS